MSKLRAILFDVDGVLLDSTAANAAFYRELFRRAGGKEFRDEDMLTNNHRSMTDMLRKYFPEKNQAEVRDLVKLGNSLDAGYDQLRIFDGVQDLIPVLAKAYRLGLVTNRTAASIEDLWRLSGLKQYFSAVAAYDHTEKHKPESEPVEFALRELQVSPAEAIFIGDSESDLKAGLAAGVRVIMISSQPWPSAYRVISTFRELPTALDD